MNWGGMCHHFAYETLKSSDNMAFTRILPQIRCGVVAGVLPIALTAFAPAANAFNLTGFYVFSDSLSDVGNFYALTGNQLPPSQLGYFDGRFSNGPVWVDYLAPQLGLTSSRQTNFSFPGVTTGFLNTTDSRLPGLQQQVLGFAAAVPQADPNALYVVWAGANDFLGDRRPDPTTTVSNLATAIQILASKGAKNFLVPNLPDLGKVPLVRDRGPELANAATAGVTAHNALLAQTLSLLDAQPDINIVPLDVFSIVNDAIANPAKFGFTNVSDACLFPSPLLLPPGPITVCSNPNEYLFWDSLHPTTVAHRFIADEALENISVSAIPEPPATAGMILCGAVMANFAIQKRKRSRAIAIEPADSKK